MDSGKAIYVSRESQVQVTSNYVRTRRHLIPIESIRAIETRRPFALYASLIGGGLAMLGCVFWPELAPIDRAIFLGLPMIGVTAASQAGALKVSFEFRDETIHGPYWRLMLIRRAIEQALFERSPANSDPPPVKDRNSC
jgi:2-polyprenyl-6-methoxyphenol hydroxylase-like FAD-dependent oxidoreductase